MSESVSEKALVLDSAKVNQKIRRIAYEIFENNFKEKSFVLAGIDGQGDDITELHQAATKLLQSRRAMNKVAVRLAAMEAKWSTDRAE